MALDIESLLVVNAANLMVMAATLPLIMGRQLSAAAASARNALLVQALAMICIVLSGLRPGTWTDQLLSAASVSLFAVGHWLMFRALQGWLGPRRFESVLLALIVVGPAGYLVLSQSFAMRTAWANTMMILQLLIVSWATLWPATRLGGRWRWVVLGCTLTMAFFTGARTVLVVFFPDLYPSFLTPHPVNVVAMLAANVTLVLVTIATLVAWREEAEAQLRDLVYTDSLTQLLNRHGWDERAPALFDQARRHGTPLALLMLDLDHFKRINDTQGHEAGDRVLTMVGDVLGSRRRTSDLAARVGGEEFALLLPQTSQEAALLFERRLRQALAAACLVAPHNRVDFSAGLALLETQDASLTALMARADAALYQAKDMGRARVEVSQKERLFTKNEPAGSFL